MPIKVFTDNKKNPQLFKVLVAAQYNGVEVQVEECNLEAESKNAEFIKKNPAAKLPYLETEEGTVFGANAAAQYVAKLGKSKLYGASSFDAATIDQWIEFAYEEIDLPAAVWVYPILGMIPNNSVATQKAKGDIRKILDVLNKHLLTRTFVAGNRITLADIALAMSLYKLYELVLDSAFRKQFVNTNRWFTTVVNQPEVKAIVGETNLCEKMQVAKEVKEAPKEAPKKEEKKPKKAEEKQPEPEDFEEEEKKEKKLPNPLDSLPPSKFIMDEWKRVYSNEDTVSKAIPWLWENFDAEGYSMWFADYKYDSELEKLFMTCNLVGGFIQRLDKVRKYGFGTVLILGQEPDLKITSAWIFRGQDIPQEMKDCDDSEHYVWTKADVTNEETKKKVNDFLNWTIPNTNQGKTFK